jgi:hypothetical protein
VEGSGLPGVLAEEAVLLAEGARLLTHDAGLKAAAPGLLTGSRGSLANSPGEPAFHIGAFAGLPDDRPGVTGGSQEGLLLPFLLPCSLLLRTPFRRLFVHRGERFDTPGGGAFLVLLAVADIAANERTRALANRGGVAGHSSACHVSCEATPPGIKAIDGAEWFPGGRKWNPRQTFGTCRASWLKTGSTLGNLRRRRERSPPCAQGTRHRSSCS